MDEAGPLTLEQLVAVLRALAETNRLRLVGLLARRPHYAQELADLLELSPATVSHHASTLRAAGLLRTRKDPPYLLYTLDEAALKAAGAMLAGGRDLGTSLQLPGEDRASARILRASFDAEGRLVEIPARKRARAVVLRWLAQRFETGHIYPEREVNRILLQFHDEVAILRQHLLDEGWMRREGGVYRRVEEADRQ
jgi:biotin operon repressor